MKTQQVELYLDHATLPSLCYFLHFVQNMSDLNTIRLFGLWRFKVPQRIIERYSPGKILCCKLQKGNYAILETYLEQILSNKNCQYDIRIHMNLTFSLELFTACYKTLKRYLSQIENIELKLYSDGSEDVINLQNVEVESPHLTQAIRQNKFELKKLLTAIEPRLSNSLSRYLLGSLFHSTYYFINDGLIKSPQFQSLADEMENVSVMNFSALTKQLSDAQKSLLFELIGLKQDFVEKMYAFFERQKVFLFTGTVVYNTTQESYDNLALLHIHGVLNFMQPSGKFFIGENYRLCFKGHPEAHGINPLMEKLFPNALHLPPQMPLEVLYLLGLEPLKVGGFMSSSYFNIPKKSITDIVFITTSAPESQSDVAQTQYTLMQNLPKLGIISPAHCHYYGDMYLFDVNVPFR